MGGAGVRALQHSIPHPVQSCRKNDSESLSLSLSRSENPRVPPMARVDRPEFCQSPPKRCCCLGGVALEPAGSRIRFVSMLRWPGYRSGRVARRAAVGALGVRRVGDSSTKADTTARRRDGLGLFFLNAGRGVP